MTEKTDEVKPHSEPNEGAGDAGIPAREDAPKVGANDESRVSGGESSHRDKVALFDKDGFQWVVAIVLVVITAALSFAMFTLVSDARYVKTENGEWVDEWVMAFFTVLIGLFGMLITGLFVFMAFRIDRGARWEAQRVAKEAAEEAAEEAKRAAQKVASKIAKDEARSVAKDTIKNVVEDAKSAARAAAAKKLRQMADDVDG